jgi:hypothetical protein
LLAQKNNRVVIVVDVIPGRRAEEVVLVRHAEVVRRRRAGEFILARRAEELVRAGMSFSRAVLGMSFSRAVLGSGVNGAWVRDFQLALLVPKQSIHSRRYCDMSFPRGIELPQSQACVAAMRKTPQSQGLMSIWFVASLMIFTFSF